MQCHAIFDIQENKAKYVFTSSFTISTVDNSAVLSPDAQSQPWKMNTDEMLSAGMQWCLACTRARLVTNFVRLRGTVLSQHRDETDSSTPTQGHEYARRRERVLTFWLIVLNYPFGPLGTHLSKPSLRVLSSGTLFCRTITRH